MLPRAASPAGPSGASGTRVSPRDPLAPRVATSACSGERGGGGAGLGQGAVLLERQWALWPPQKPATLTDQLMVSYGAGQGWASLPEARPGQVAHAPHATMAHVV